MGFGLFNSESESNEYTYTTNLTDSQNRTSNRVWNLSEVGNTTVTIPSAPPVAATASVIESLALPIVALGMLGLAGLFLLRRT